MPSKVEEAHEDLGKCLALTERPKNPPIQKSVVKSNGSFDEIVETETNLLLPSPEQNENLINSKSQTQSHDWIEMEEINTIEADSDETNKDFNEELQLKVTKMEEKEVGYQRKIADLEVHLLELENEKKSIQELKKKVGKRLEKYSK
jgi:hypothetical protein